MLQLKNIKKDYIVAGVPVPALNGVSLSFKRNEFVSILGASGSGKTTLLNIVGGLDRYTSGDLLVDGKSTQEFSDNEWDAYRNATIGFVFQNYNLISHLSVLDNVEMALRLSGVSAKERKERATKVLTDVGLIDHIHKKPNQLSGGQMQRVAIARALVNNPMVLLADEPSGALDSKTSHQIMELIQVISKDRLVIMVTHNSELANTFSDRIVRLIDGRVI
ncbi:MAG: ABC transporter ATP-binding protein, partial [Firmicutes bacterium]|nr:ABC transporter ATP-binding protein [Bacillota bacterium]